VETPKSEEEKHLRMAKRSNQAAIAEAWGTEDGSGLLKTALISKLEAEAAGGKVGAEASMAQWRSINFVSPKRPKTPWKAPSKAVVLVTCTEDPHLIPDDCFLLNALLREGLTPCIKMWDDPLVDWSSVHVLLLRSLWEYVDRYDEFKSFVLSLIHMGAYPASDLTNLLWHSHKRYLLELQEAGSVPTVPSAMLSPSPCSPINWLWPQVQQVAATKGWEVVVVKPALGSQGDGVEVYRAFGPTKEGVGASSRGSSISSGSSGGGSRPRRMLEQERQYRGKAMLVQPFLPLVSQLGEVCLIYIQGRFSHCVHKDPRYWGKKQTQKHSTECMVDQREHRKDDTSSSSNTTTTTTTTTTSSSSSIEAEMRRKSVQHVPIYEVGEVQRLIDDAVRTSVQMHAMNDATSAAGGTGIIGLPSTAITSAAVQSFASQPAQLIEPCSCMLIVAEAALKALPGGIPTVARFDLLPSRPSQCSGSGVRSGVRCSECIARLRNCENVESKEVQGTRAAGEGGVAAGEGGVAAGEGGVAAGEGGVAVGEGGMGAGEGEMGAGEGEMGAGEGELAAGEGEMAVEWLLSEIEVFGPELFLRLRPEAATEVAQALKTMLAGVVGGSDHIRAAVV
jgi:hypothetical protein